MPQQCGPLLITGTIDNVCFYKMSGKYYARMKSSLTRKRVLKDPKFLPTRIHAALLGEASKIASGVYRLITGKRKKHALYREMTGKAIYMLREGKDKKAVFQCLSGQYLKPELVEQVAFDIRRAEAKPNRKSCSKIMVAEIVRGLKKIPLSGSPLRTGKRRRRFRAMVNRRQPAVGDP